MEMRELQLLKAPAPISKSWDGRSKATEARPEQEEKHEEPILWSDDGSRIDSNFEHSVKQESAISTSCDPDSNSTEERARSLAKEETPIFFTDAGMTIDCK
jgi:hypothetical protein